MSTQKLRIASTIFLAYFAFFSVSLLAYNDDTQTSLFSSGHHASDGIELSFPIAELISDLLDGPNNSDCDDSGDIVLLKKKRAVLSSQKNISTLAPSRTSFLETGGVTLYPRIIHFLFMQYASRPEPGFLRIWSGLSPPSV
jgi:hypothetical protein